MAGKIMVYTDGGCTGNPGPGGWAAIVLKDGRIVEELAGGERETTNNRMELTAVIRVLEWVLETGRGRGLAGLPVEIYTDSQYVQKGMSEWMKSWLARGWKTAAKKPVKNRDLWMRLNELNAQVQVVWRWVRGHSGNEWNERCDELVGIERDRQGL